MSEEAVDNETSELEEVEGESTEYELGKEVREITGEPTRKRRTLKASISSKAEKSAEQNKSEKGELENDSKAGQPADKMGRDAAHLSAERFCTIDWPLTQTCTSNSSAAFSVSVATSSGSHASSGGDGLNSRDSRALSMDARLTAESGRQPVVNGEKQKQL